MDNQSSSQDGNPKLSQGRHPDYNPRKISATDYANLKQSMLTFGPLEGIVQNVCTNNFVGGNQRTRGLRELGADDIVVTWRATETPDPSGPATLAYGYVLLNGERHSWRQVYWPTDAVDSNGQPYSSKERAANVAANRIQGEWDKDLLAQLDYELSQLPNAEDLLALTGQGDKELQDLLSTVGADPNGEEEPDQLGPDDHEGSKREIRATQGQWEVIDEALEYIKSHKDIPAEDQGSRNGSALYYMARDFLDRLHGMAPDEQTTAATPGELTDIPTNV